MNKTSMLSYLLYEDGKITIDEITPLDRFGILYDNNTVHTSASVGKSFVSYVTGHAICEGYISSIDHKLNDWELLENTLFYDQKLIDAWGWITLKVSKYTGISDYSILDQKIIDGTSHLTQYVSGQLRKTQSGIIQNYLLGVLAVLVVIIILINQI